MFQFMEYMLFNCTVLGIIYIKIFIIHYSCLLCELYSKKALYFPNVIIRHVMSMSIIFCLYNFYMGNCSIDKSKCYEN